MHENICLQCNKTPSGPSHRLVRDSCGHEKCRVCLLEDENDCKLCVDPVYKQKTLLKDSFKPSNNIKCDKNEEIEIHEHELIVKEEVLNNHTGVIQINGNVQSTPNHNNGEVKLEPKTLFFEKNSEETPSHSFSESALNSLKVENKNIVGSKIKKPDKKILRRSYTPLIIPKHVNETLDPLMYHCTICKKSFTTKTHVKYHVYCAGATKPYRCEVCGKEFILRSQLDVHSYKHKSSKPYKCQTCNKSFADRSKLTRHSAVHSTVKSHICSICGNGYRSKESLKIHALIHRSERPFACTLCNAKFSHQSNLNKHGLVHKKEKTHMCDLCGKRYKQKWALTVHKSSHFRGKTFECNICFKSFNQNKDLQRHNLIHSETKQYKCSICTVSFRRRDNLRRHMKNSHPGKKGEVIKNTIPSTSKIPSSTVSSATIQNLTDNENTVDQKDIKPVIDNPNAIHVITSTTPASTLPLSRADVEPVSLPSAAKSDSRAADSSGNSRVDSTATSVINGPIKLAFKTPAFKNNYNINRGFDHLQPVVQLQNTYNMAESVEICQKIMSTDTSLPVRNTLRKDVPATSTEICQKILDPTCSRPLHYETSFQNEKHAMIKNIKFKVPVQYTNQFNNKESNKKDQRTADDDSTKIFAELRPASVIVNSNDLDLVETTESLHWRRRTSQNLNWKNLN